MIGFQLGEIQDLPEVQHQNYPIIDGRDSGKIAAAQPGDGMMRGLNGLARYRAEFARRIDDQSNLSPFSLHNDQARTQRMSEGWETETNSQIHRRNHLP